MPLTDLREELFVSARVKKVILGPVHQVRDVVELEPCNCYSGTIPHGGIC